MKYLILEDEPLAAEKLQRAISKQEPDWICEGIIPSVRLARQLIPRSKAELLFIDIHLADGLSFSLFEEIEVKTPLIFTTAYDQYALKAFELNSIDYLLKPVTDKDLRRALNKLVSRNFTPSYQNLEKLISQLKPDYKKRFLVSTGQRIKTLNGEDIAFFFARGKHSFITTTDGREYLLDTPLTTLIEKLDPSVFYRINRQFIVHINAIEEIIPYSKGRVKLLLEPPASEEVIVSVEKSPRFKQWVAGEL